MVRNTSNERLDDITPSQVSLRIMSAIASKAENDSNEFMPSQLKYLDNSNTKRNNWFHSCSLDEFMIENDDVESSLQNLL